MKALYGLFHRVLRTHKDVSGPSSRIHSEHDKTKRKENAWRQNSILLGVMVVTAQNVAEPISETKDIVQA